MSRSAQPFGRYELLERISAGGMAEVFRARDAESSHVVALKRILPQVAEDDEFIKMFEDEARIASQLEHPHIARTLDFGRVDDSYYIAFEFVNGRDLRAVFDRSARLGEKPPLPFLLYVFARIGEGLAYAHARRDGAGNPQSIVHRDVSPQNIVVSFDGDVKLIDFGIAKAAGKLSRTQVGTLKGKFGYMAPEQIKGQEIDHRADLFSLGICMWELLTLERLFSGENELLVLEKVRSATIAPPSSRNHDVPPELDRVVLKALAKDPNERYRGAKDIFRDLEKLAESIGATASRDEVARYMRRAFPESLARRPTPSDTGSSYPGTPSAPHARPGAPPPPHGSNGRPSIRPRTDLAAKQETSTMAADIPSSEKRGSDLDIFEGLGKKPGGASSRPASVPPPPPSRQNPPLVVKSDVAKKTLVGVAPGALAQPTTPASGIQAPGRLPAPPPRSTPPPPPGRASLPQVVPPPQRASAAPPAAAAPPPATTARGIGSAPPPAAATAKSNLDMDWDDEDEATHIFDKQNEPGDEGATREKAALRPAAGTPLAPPVDAPNGQHPRGGIAAIAKSTLIGVPAPAIPAPPSPGSGRASTPPPPPSVNAFARTPSIPPSFPAPTPPPGHAMAPQVNTAPMPMPGGRPGSVPAPPMPSSRPNAMENGAAYGGSQPAPAMPAMGGMASQGGFVSQPPPQLPPVSAPPIMATRAMEATQLVRPPSSGRMGIIGTGIVFAALAMGLVVFIMMPRTGAISVNVSDAKGATVNRVEIFVDGKKQCDVSPCKIENVSAGSHQVKVMAQGYDAIADRTVSVEARKDADVAFALAPASKGTGIKVSGSQPGVKLYVDGKEIGPLPQEIRDLAPGDHKIRVAGTDRYAPMEKSVIVAQDEIQDLGDTTLKVVKGKATVTLGTPGARVSIVSGTDRRELPTLPIAVDLDTSKPWTLEASKAGYSDYRQPVSFEDGVAEKTFNISLDAKAAPAYAAAPPAAAPQAPAAAAKWGTIPPTTPKVAKSNNERDDDSDDGDKAPAPAPKAAAATASADKGGGDSFLNINSMPASSVVLDGKPIGNTPKVHVQVPPGNHTVLFVNADQGLKKQITVTVGAGETKPAIAKLRE